MKVAMKNPRTGDVKQVKCGWCWTLFLFSSVLGLPLFVRRLYVLGFLFLALCVLILAASYVIADRNAAFHLQMTMLFVFVGLQICLGVKGNEMTAKNYLDLGWKFVDPQSEAVLYACGRWGLSPTGDAYGAATEPRVG